MGRYKTHDGNASVLLSDFERRGNWHEWCSLEVLYRQYTEIFSLTGGSTQAIAGLTWLKPTHTSLDKKYPKHPIAIRQ